MSRRSNRRDRGAPDPRLRPGAYREWLNQQVASGRMSTAEATRRAVETGVIVERPSYSATAPNQWQAAAQNVAGGFGAPVASYGAMPGSSAGGFDLSSFIFGGMAPGVPSSMPFGGVVGSYVPEAFGQPFGGYTPAGYSPAPSPFSALDQLLAPALAPVGGLGNVLTGLEVVQDIRKGDWGEAALDAAPLVGFAIGGPAGAAIAGLGAGLFDAISDLF